MLNIIRERIELLGNLQLITLEVECLSIIIWVLRELSHFRAFPFVRGGGKSHALNHLSVLLSSVDDDHSFGWCSILVWFPLCLQQSGPQTVGHAPLAGNEGTFGGVVGPRPTPMGGWGGSAP